MDPRPDTNDYRALFLADTPMMDMRAPVEFAAGAFPSALSLPLMTDDERTEVGICYKKNGQQAAIALGQQLVCGELRAQRLRGWSDFAERNPNGYLYCFRGGLRSQTVQSWLREQDIDYPLVRGGYKAMRRFLLNEMERSIAEADFVLISGKTGTGKTRVIGDLSRSVDLEGLAGHRGSTFGQLPQEQPSQIQFENAVAIALMKLLAVDSRRIYLEDEGKLIGRVCLPPALCEKMQRAPVLVVEESLERRINIVVEDYVVDLGQRYISFYGDQGPQLHCEKLQQDLFRIRKRLGGERYQQVSEILIAAFAQQFDSGDVSLHRDWITILLEQYYDPMYEYQFGQRTGTRKFTGSRTAVVDWALAAQ